VNEAQAFIWDPFAKTAMSWALGQIAEVLAWQVSLSFSASGVPARRLQSFGSDVSVFFKIGTTAEVATEIVDCLRSAPNYNSRSIIERELLRVKDQLRMEYIVRVKLLTVRPLAVGDDRDQEGPRNGNEPALGALAVAALAATGIIVCLVGVVVAMTYIVTRRTRRSQILAQESHQSLDHSDASVFDVDCKWSPQLSLREPGDRDTSARLHALASSSRPPEGVPYGKTKLLDDAGVSRSAELAAASSGTASLATQCKEADPGDQSSTTAPVGEQARTSFSSSIPVERRGESLLFSRWPTEFIGLGVEAGLSQMNGEGCMRQLRTAHEFTVDGEDCARQLRRVSCLRQQVGGGGDGQPVRLSCCPGEGLGSRPTPHAPASRATE